MGLNQRYCEAELLSGKGGDSQIDGWRGLRVRDFFAVLAYPVIVCVGVCWYPSTLSCATYLGVGDGHALGIRRMGQIASG